MPAEHLEILVEEPSMEAFLNELMPRLLGDGKTFTIHAHQGKIDLLQKLERRLRAYAKWLPRIARIIVVVDRDDDDCIELKQKLETAADAAGLLTRSTSGTACWQVVNRLAVEELEAWFFGEWSAVRAAYPRVPEAVPAKAAYRFSDAIAGGTWEALERVLKSAGYFASGYRKMEAAGAIGKHFDPTIASSPSFVKFHSAVTEAFS